MDRRVRARRDLCRRLGCRGRTDGALHAASLGVCDGVRPTDDVDVLVDVRTRPAATRELARWLSDHDFDHAGASPDGIGHRYTRPASPGPGTVIVDVLAPEGLGARASLTTTPPARTVQVPGGTQALHRAERVEVAVADMTGARHARLDLPGDGVGIFAAASLQLPPASLGRLLAPRQRLTAA